jgi:D-alanyl-D-alanine-carboxypeptidase/D-alanyl-D-alanine-endopeptidase
MRMLPVVFAGAIAATALNAPAVPATLPPMAAPSNAAIQALLNARVADNPGTGIVVGIIDRGRTMVLKAGVSGTARPLDEHSLFEVGSVTKTFTATVLADMALRHEVDLSDPVQRDLPSGTRVPERDGKTITLLSLATQHSGLPRMPGNFEPEHAEDPYVDYTYDRLAAFLNSYTLPRDPGERFEYSNLGVGLLGDALADEAHTTYASLVATRVFAPLGMTETSALSVDALPATLRDRITTGHDDAGKVTAPWNFDALAGAGAIRSSVSDMLRFVRCNLGQGPLAPTCLFAQASRDSFPGSRIGLIWMIGDIIPIVHHGGDTAGFHAAVALTPDRERGVVVLANGGGPVDALAQALIDSAIVPQVSEPALALDAGQLDAYAGTYRGDNGIRFLFVRNGGTLTAQLGGQPAVPVFARAKDEFFHRIVPAELTFARAADDTVNGVILHQNRVEIVFTREGSTTPVQIVPPPPPLTLDDATLAGYAGTYVADAELAFTVALGGDSGITVQLTGQRALPVYASAKDAFYTKVVRANIIFVRNAAGTVTALLLHQNGRLTTAERI